MTDFWISWTMRLTLRQARYSFTTNSALGPCNKKKHGWQSEAESAIWNSLIRQFFLSAMHF